MRHVVSTSLFVLACALAQPAFAQTAQLEDKPVPMDKAPFHIPVFANDYLIVLNVNIPPGRNTGYHTHYAELGVGEPDPGLADQPEFWLVRSKRAGDRRRRRAGPYDVYGRHQERPAHPQGDQCRADAVP